MQIRNTEKSEYRLVEELTRKAFWNLHIPGCDEHYLAHKLRNHKDYIPELDFVAVKDGNVVGNIMYSHSYLQDGNHKLATLTFGPVSVLPEFQRKGIGSELITHSIEAVKKSMVNAIIIFGNPSNYCKFGFVGSKSVNIATPDGRHPCALLVKELKKGVFANHKWHYFESTAYEVNQDGFDEYDATFEKMEKKYQYTQELFSILSNAYIEG
ncbi:N-acetyltransferase [bacterium]|nr:N-acetyltransferase [bacterium]